jgi:hypothetical protein
MRESLTPYDLPVLKGWQYGLTTSYMWKKDVKGTDWQMWTDNGEFLLFAEKSSRDGPMLPFRRLRHEEYKELFA